MGAFSDDIFIAMREDYKLRGEDSFLFRYFSETRKAEIKKRARKTKQTETKIVHYMVRDKMYDLGFPLKTGKIIPLKKRRLKSKELEMISSWVDEESSAGTWQGSLGPDLDSYHKLYEAMNVEKRQSALVPVVIEPDTGRGICIVGKRLYNNFPKYYEKMGRTCGISFMEWDEDQTGGDFTKLRITFTETEEVFPNIYEAYAWLLGNTAKGKYETFRAYNGDMPENTPEKLRRYFECWSEEEIGITDEDVLEARKEIEQGFLQL